MADFTQDEINLILSRGFKGKDFPLLPVMGYSKSAAGVPNWYDWEDFPQKLYNLGDVDTWSGGVGRTEDYFIWEADTAVEEAGIYQNAKKLKLKIRPRDPQTNVGNNLYIVWTDENGNELSDTWALTDFSAYPTNTSVRIGDLSVVCFIDNTNLELCFGVTYSELKSYSVIPETIYSVTPMNKCGRSGNFEKNQPFYNFMNEGDPTWYDEESQVPELAAGGGGGGFYRPSDTNWFSGLPSLDILAFGIVAQYQVSAGDMISLARYLWSDSFIENIKKAWQSPFENIINLSFVPLNTEIEGANANIEIGNIDTGIQSRKLSKSLYEKDFGSINLKELYKNFADYAPFTKLSCYLPGCGIKTLNPDDYMDGRLYLKGYIDIFSGTIVYQTGSIRHGKQHIVDHYEGNIQTSIPITGANYAAAYQSAINGLAQMGSGNVMGAANSFMNIKPDFGKASGVSGSAMRLSLQRPYIFFDTPQLKQAKQFRQLHGYVSNLYEKLSNCFGYVSIKYIDLSGLNAPESVKDRILEKLRAGVHIHTIGG